MGKQSACNAGVAGAIGLIPGSGRSPGGGQPTLGFLPGESPWMEEPGGLQSMGLQELDTAEVTEYTRTPKSTKWQERYSGGSLHCRWGGYVHAHFMDEKTEGLSLSAAPRERSVVCLVAGPLSCPSQCLACVEETAKILGLGSWHWRLSSWVTLSKSSSLAFSVCPKAMTAILSSLGRHED